MEVVAAGRAKGKIRGPKKAQPVAFKMDAETGHFAVLGCDAETNVVAFPDAPTSAEIKATKKEFLTTARM